LGDSKCDYGELRDDARHETASFIEAFLTIFYEATL
jgi:hypothetical protein